MRDAPFVSPELLKYLEETFPNRCPPFDTPIAKVRALAGEQRVLDHLRRLCRDQTARSGLNNKEK